MTDRPGLTPLRLDELLRELPYGVWKCADGREVLFNRQYEPLWQRHHGEIALADPKEWVRSVSEVFFYNDLQHADEALIARLTGIVQAFCTWRPVDSLHEGAA